MCGFRYCIRASLAPSLKRAIILLIEQLLSLEQALDRQSELAIYLCLQIELLGYYYSTGKRRNELPNTFLDKATYYLIFRGATFSGGPDPSCEEDGTSLTSRFQA